MSLERLKDSVLAYAEKNAVEGLPYPTAIAHLNVSRHLGPSDPFPVVYEPLFCLVLQGAKQAWLHEREVTFAAGRSVVVGMDLPTFAQVIEASPEAPYVALALRLDVALIRELASEMQAAATDEGSIPAIASGEASEALIDAMARLFALLEKPAAASFLQAGIIREIHFWLLTADHGDVLRRVASGGSHTARISDAARFIRQHFTEPLRVPELARQAGMSETTFHQHFRNVCGTTPLQYQKHMRLMEAQRLITAQGEPVSTAALAVGYESPTQFSREFSRLFGMSPRSYRQAVSPAV
ncbi:AraC family transcriptional regulator [Pseudohoeflea suaedae]|uniref:AraC family transcriptional regulator n=1 Tax=Pseudohoeflea suaedae TaxID=877384 RepID=A0A4R5PHC0_9HYPH|nr:AraC family transcriptional regulator [Pseudohoeflea suaedae]TDH34304.1 AraC family transcriptional regulator [Pseudohoeflea suaedae]